MRVWLIERQHRAPIVMAWRERETLQRAAMRARKLLGIAGRGHAMYSDHSTVFYIRDYGRSIVARREEVAFPFGDAWTAWLREKAGAGWCVAPRLTARLRDKGYTRAISQLAFNDLQADYLTQKGIPK